MCGLGVPVGRRMKHAKVPLCLRPGKRQAWTPMTVVIRVRVLSVWMVFKGLEGF